MKVSFPIVRPLNLSWRWLIIASLYISISAHAAVLLESKTPVNIQFSQFVSQLEQQGIEDYECDGDQLCERLKQLCQEQEVCQQIIEICMEDPDLCIKLLGMTECDDEGQCEEEPECDSEEESCETESDESCDPDEQQCDEVGSEDEEEGSEEEQECNPDEDECDIPLTTTGYNNPNPVADDTVMQVDMAKALQASRFLTQASLGADYATITQVATVGETQWLESQFQEPAGFLFPYTDYLVKKVSSLSNEDLYGSPVKYHMHAWWTQVMTSPDALRQRVAMALSEIFVVSSHVEILGESPYAMSHYYDTLLKHSFGNYRDLLKGISLTPAMAIYLSHLNNEKADPSIGRFPDENYAREVMQLFSIGLFELNPDGSRKKDAQGNDIATYGQNEIREFAKIFTGLSMDTEGFFGGEPGSNEDFYPYAKTLKPLTMFDEHHSTGEKKLLNGTIVPAGQTGMQDIDDAIDNLFNHPNVGPFIGKLLIQRLVTSNPSPAYIGRVSAAFAGNGETPRGDMKALIRAILLDPEARTAPEQASSHQGRLREPFIRLVRLARSFNAITPDRNFAAEGIELSQRLKQSVLYAPSVFNFFQPDYRPNGEIKDAGLVSPEFQVTNASTIIEIKNLVTQWLNTGRFEEPLGALHPESLNFYDYLQLAGDANALLNRLDLVMTYGTLSASTRDAIRKVIEAEPDHQQRIRKAVYLMAISPDYAVSI